MTTTINTTDESFWTKLDKFSDKRTRGWFLVDSPIEVTFVITAFLFMVWCGPKLMEKRRPFKMKGFLIVYNFFLVLMNAIIVKDLYVGGSRLGYGYFCHQNTNDYHPEEMRILNGVWWYYMSKGIEFVDTLCFILRKKDDQLSVLHIYHHCTIFIYAWTSIKWYPSGTFSRMPMLNSLVHVIMYSYYGLSAIGPGVQKYLWWKKYLTTFQLIQFGIALVYSINSFVTGCNNYGSPVDVWNIVYMCSFLYLFGKFYLKKYTKKVK